MNEPPLKRSLQKENFEIQDCSAPPEIPPILPLIKGGVNLPLSKRGIEGDLWASLANWDFIFIRQNSFELWSLPSL
jgi:hypothetical protein